VHGQTPRMGFAQVLSRAQAGLASPQVTVEVHLGSGLPTFSIVGLPAAAVRESRERVRAALATCGFDLPAGRITVNLAPADLPKEGGRYDLAVALGILLASGQIKPRFDVARTEFYGELALTGEIKAVPGLLLAALHAGRAGHALVIPACNAADVRQASAEVHALGWLAELAPGDPSADQRPQSAPVPQVVSPEVIADRAARAGAGAPPDLADVRGQHQAKRALLITAAGGHSLLMLGPPGSGKTMLAQRLPGLLPLLDPAQALEVAAIAAVAQCVPGAHATGAGTGSPLCPPFRAPHHTASANAIVGGGTAVQPGEVSLAHHGVLFLDELPEFDRRVLESLREPLESGRVSVVRANQRAEYPAAFLLVAAMNPCPCGRQGLVSPLCRCNQGQIDRYRGRISGPLMDRIDLQLRLAQVEARELTGAGDHVLEPSLSPDGFTTAEARALVARARERQLSRQGCLNARLQAGDTLKFCRADAASLTLLARAAAKRGASARAQHRILRVARSIADLAERDHVQADDVAEAVALRLED
jgi:magnesium chelatase family protein